MFETTLLKSEENNQMHPLVDQRDKIGDKYTILKHLGIPSGQADLYLCSHGNEQVIVKLYKHGVIVDPLILKKISKIKSNRLVPVLDTGSYKGRYYEIQPYYSKGDLSRVEPLGEDLLRDYIVPFINEALKEIHVHNLAHMDLKPSNIFIDDSDDLYLGDFGISSVLSDASVKITTAKGTFGYRPPESYSEISIKSTQFDYYSFGMTLIHLWNGYSPYEGLSEMQIMAYTLDGKIHMPEKMPEDLKLLIHGLTAYDKRKRIGYEAVKRWCEGFDIRDQVDLGGPVGKRFRLPGEYDFMGEVLKDIVDFAKVISQSEKHWDEAIMRLKNDLFDDFILGFGDDAVAILFDAKKKKNSHYALAYLVFKLSGGLIVWKTDLYPNPDALGLKMQNSFPKMDKFVREIIESGFMEELVENHKTYSPYEIAYILSNETIFNYGQERVTSFEALSKCLLKQGGDLLNEMDRLMRDSYFNAWLRHLEARGRNHVR